PTQRGGAGHLAINTDCRLHRHVLAQRTVVVQVLPAQSQTVHALAQHVTHGVCDEQRAAWIGNAARCRIRQAKFAIRLGQQHHPGIAGHAAAVKTTLYDSSAKPAKFNLVCSNFFGTVWHWQSSCCLASNTNDNAPSGGTADSYR